MPAAGRSAEGRGRDRRGRRPSGDGEEISHRSRSESPKEHLTPELSTRWPPRMHAHERVEYDPAIPSKEIRGDFMKVYDSLNIRNVALVGHGGAGKTSRASALLFAMGAVNRLGQVEDGTTPTDFDPDE